jgi:D-beta-D-heptose 7-phosphate kinase/D-beta-D-heptose 1-phosphate adenosyltransferase
VIEDIDGLINKLKHLRILVVGDFMLDETLWGEIQRISPEAPVPILTLSRSEETLGGAGNIVANLRGLDTQVSAVGVLGDDETGESIQQRLNELGVDAALFFDRARSSTRKSRLMSLEHEQQVFRVDREMTLPLDTKAEQWMLQELQAKCGGIHSILCSDYLKGAMTPAILRAVMKIGGASRVPVIVCPKGGDLVRYRGANIIIHNQKELELMSGVRIDDEDSLIYAARKVFQLLQVQCLVVTRGKKGMLLLYSRDAAILTRHIPTVARNVFDVTGAGDTVASVFTATVTAGYDYETAALVANIAAGIVVGKQGTASIDLPEIVEQMREDLQSQVLSNAV